MAERDEATGSPDSSQPAPRFRLWVVIGGSVAALAIIALLVVLAVRQGHDQPIVIPPRVDGLVLDDHPGAEETVNHLRRVLEADIRLSSTAGAVYADEAGRSRSIIFVGGVGSLASPRPALDKAFTVVASEVGAIEEVQEVPAGSLGGVVKCGHVKANGGPTPVCAWADRTSLGIALFPNRDTPESAALLQMLRSAIRQST